MRIKTTVSTVINLWDLNGNWVPSGNYFFLIRKIDGKGNVSGILSNKHFSGNFLFKCKDLFKMMSIAQSRLARRCCVNNERGMPNYPSPLSSPISDYPNRTDFNLLKKNGKGNNFMNLFDSLEDNVNEIIHSNEISNSFEKEKENENQIIEINDKGVDDNHSSKIFFCDYELNRDSLDIQKKLLKGLNDNNLLNNYNNNSLFKRLLRQEKKRREEERKRKEEEKKRNEEEKKRKEEEKKRKEEERKNKEHDNTCMICLLEINSNLKILPCAHKYHRHCIDKWLSFKRNCPMCRQSVNITNSVSMVELNNRRGRRNHQTRRESRFRVENANNYYNSVMTEARRITRNRYRL